MQQLSTFLFSILKIIWTQMVARKNINYFDIIYVEASQTYINLIKPFSSSPAFGTNKL
jgi:hypothetical protein